MSGDGEGFKLYKHLRKVHGENIGASSILKAIVQRRDLFGPYIIKKFQQEASFQELSGKLPEDIESILKEARSADHKGADYKILIEQVNKILPNKYKVDGVLQSGSLGTVFQSGENVIKWSPNRVIKSLNKDLEKFENVKKQILEKNYNPTEKELSKWGNITPKEYAIEKRLFELSQIQGIISEIKSFISEANLNNEITNSKNLSDAYTKTDMPKNIQIVIAEKIDASIDPSNGYFNIQKNVMNIESDRWHPMSLKDFNGKLGVGATPGERAQIQEVVSKWIDNYFSRLFKGEYVQADPHSGNGIVITDRNTDLNIKYDPQFRVIDAGTVVQLKEPQLVALAHLMGPAFQKSLENHAGDLEELVKNPKAHVSDEVRQFHKLTLTFMSPLMEDANLNVLTRFHAEDYMKFLSIFRTSNINVTPVPNGVFDRLGFTQDVKQALKAVTTLRGLVYTTNSITEKKMKASGKNLADIEKLKIKDPLLVMQNYINTLKNKKFKLPAKYNENLAPYGEFRELYSIDRSYNDAEFDKKVQDIMNKYGISAQEKQQLIEELDKQRQELKKHLLLIEKKITELNRLNPDGVDQKTLSDLNRKLMEKEAELSEINNKLSEAANENTTLNNKLKELENEKKNLEKQLKIRNEQQEKINSLESEISVLKTSNTDLAKRNADLNSLIEKLKTANLDSSQMVSVNKKLKGQSEALIHDMEELHKNLKKLETEKFILNNRLELLEGQYQREHMENDYKTSTISEHKEEVDKLENLISKKDSYILKLKKQLAAYNKLTGKVRNLTILTKPEIQKILKQVKDQREASINIIRKIVDNFNNLKGKSESAQKEISRLKQRLEKLNQELSDSKNEIKNLKEKNGELEKGKDDLAKIRKEKRQLQEKITTILGKKSSLSDIDILNEINRLKKSGNQLKMDIAKKSQELTIANAEKVDNLKKLGDLERDRDKVASLNKRFQRSIENYDALIKKHASENDPLVKKMEELKSKLADIQTQKPVPGDKKSGLETELDETRTKLISQLSSSTELQELRKKTGILEGEIKSLREKNNFVERKTIGMQTETLKNGVQKYQNIYLFDPQIINNKARIFNNSSKLNPAGLLGGMILLMTGGALLNEGMSDTEEK